MSPAQLSTLCNDLQSAINGINANKVLIDWSQANHFLQQHKTLENNILFGIVPDIESKGEIDNFKCIVKVTFMVLHKTNTKNTTHEMLIQDISTNTNLQALEIIKFFNNETSNPDYCSITNKMISFSLYAIYFINEHDGWGCDINFEMDL
jgi:hypothetical protein